MVKRRERGERFPPGQTQREIVKFILNYENGVREVEIKSFLFKEFGISDQRSIKNHLNKLTSDGILIKEESRGKSNVWRLNYENFKQVGYFLISNYLNRNQIAKSEREFAELLIISDEVYHSPGVQKFILENSFVRPIMRALFSNFIDLDIEHGSIRREIKIDADNMKLIETITTKCVLKSPQLFIASFLPNPVISISFHLVMKNNLLSDFNDDDLILYLTINFLLTGLFLDALIDENATISTFGEIFSLLSENNKAFFTTYILHFLDVKTIFDDPELKKRIETQIV